MIHRPGSHVCGTRLFCLVVLRIDAFQVVHCVRVTPVPFGISGTGVSFYASELGDFFHIVSNAAHEGS